jgi:hypothetical protein
VYMWSNKRITKCNEKNIRNQKLQPFHIFTFYYGNAVQRKCCKNCINSMKIEIYIPLLYFHLLCIRSVKEKSRKNQHGGA